ncbi:alanine racemase [Bradyrhizobium sp. RT11b]|uniref:alanine racemase n=1 Tax=Bradyrhizobium sp. RT11b TaxID=3156332 RepID=UPI003396B1CC
MQLCVDLDKIFQNAVTVKRICEEAGVQLRAALKSYYCRDAIVRVLQNAGVEKFCTTGLPGRSLSVQIPRHRLHWLKLLPPGGHFEQVTIGCSSSLHSETSTVSRASACAARNALLHEYIVSVDIGDRRDGISPSEFPSFLAACRRYHHEYFRCGGISVNHTCCELAIPVEEHFREVSTILAICKEEEAGSCECFSVGGSVVLGYFLNGGSLAPYNEVRVGGALLVGEIEFFPGSVPGLRNPFQICSNILEVKKKLVRGKVCRRAILDFGSIHADMGQTHPAEPLLNIVGWSSEYTVLDCTERPDIAVGDELRFWLGYQAMARAMSCSLLEKVFL